VSIEVLSTGKLSGEAGGKMSEKGNLPVSTNSGRCLLKITVILVMAVILYPAVGNPAADDLKGTLNIGGTGGAIGSMKELAAAFQKKHPGVAVSIIAHLGTRGGINGVLKGALDIGLAGRYLSPQELAQGLQEVEYARSPFVFATRSGEEWIDLNLGVIAGIYRGDIRKWPDGTTIRLILRPAGDVDTLMLKAISPTMKDAVLRAESRKGMMIALDDQENCDLLEKIKGAFGTSTLTQIISEERSLAMLPLNGVTPGIKATVSGSYPYYKPFCMITRARSSPLSKEFLEFVKSPAGRKVLTRTGNYIPGPR
jgi:phosphate transport system substrate-binding protein